MHVQLQTTETQTNKDNDFKNKQTKLKKQNNINNNANNNANNKINIMRNCFNQCIL